MGLPVRREWSIETPPADAPAAPAWWPAPVKTPRTPPEPAERPAPDPDEVPA
jgi:hypothetical protein